MRRIAAFATIAAASTACGSGGDDGPTVDAGPSPQHVSGTIRYEDRAQEIVSSRTALKPAVPVPARAVQVALFADDADGTMLASGVAGEDGTYAFDYVAATGAMVHVTAIAQSAAALRPFKVVTASSANSPVHAFGGEPFPVGTETADVLVTVDSKEAEAFNVFDMMLTGFDKMHDFLNDPAPVPLTVKWFVGNNEPTHFIPSEIVLNLEGFASDDDGFDDTVMLHEFGHYVSFTQSRDDSPGGLHDDTPTDPRLAWSEGWATYWEMVVFNAPLYIDTSMSGGFFDNNDAEVETASLASPLTQLVREGMVTEILWDLGDADAGSGVADDDPYVGTHEANVLVLKNYLKTATLRNVGTSGVDLLDFLDGWFIANGLSGCAAVKTIVHDVHQYPYDFTGPGGACP